MATQQPVGRFKFSLASLNSDGRWGIALLAICALLLALDLAGGESARMALRYDRTALEDGEWWRLLTAHFVHLNLKHALLNTAGIVLMWALFARDYTPRQWALILLVCIAAVDAGLWFRDADLIWYVGASGVLHGAMAAGALAHLRRGEFDGWIIATFLVAKLIYEGIAGAMPFSSGVGPIVIHSHLYGAAGGLTAAIIVRFYTAEGP